jgi:hypothetical protein
MIAKIGRSSNLYGALTYNNKKVASDKGKILLVHKMIETTDGQYTVAQLARSFDSYLAANRNTEKHTVHISLNPDPKDKVSDETFIELAQEYMKKLGYGDQPYVVFQHLDIDRTHIHIVSVGVDEMGKKISDQFEKRRSMEICRTLENKYGLAAAAKKADHQYAPMFRPVDYKSGNIKNQIASVIRHLPKYYQFRSLGEYNALLSLFNITAEKVEVDVQGKLQSGLLYFPLNGEGIKAGHAFKASLFGQNSSLTALEKHFVKCRETLKDNLLRSQLKEKIADIMQSTATENEFKNILIRYGINTVIRRNSNGIMYGITFIDHTSKTVWNGSSLGKEFSSNAFSTRWEHKHFPEGKSAGEEKDMILGKSRLIGSFLEKPHFLFDFLETHQKSIASDEGFLEALGGLFSFTVEGEPEEQEFAHRMRKKRKRKR